MFNCTFQSVNPGYGQEGTIIQSRSSNCRRIFFFGGRREENEICALGAGGYRTHFENGRFISCKSGRSENRETGRRGAGRKVGLPEWCCFNQMMICTLQVRSRILLFFKKKKRVLYTWPLCKPGRLSVHDEYLEEKKLKKWFRGAAGEMIFIHVLSWIAREDNVLFLI